MIEINGFYVTFTHDIGVNVGGAFCEVYTDKELDNKIDDFVISNNTHPSLWEECAKGYIDNFGSGLRV